jgi:choline dehydrogenase
MIDPGYLTDPADTDALVRAVSMAREIADAKPLRKMWSAEEAPGPEVRSDAQIREFVRRDVTTIYHPVGTCAMSGESQLDIGAMAGVVDTELKVRGVEGLRVVDASVMPTVPRGNTNAPTIAIAERAADLISGRAPLAAVEPTDLALAAVR